MNGRVFELDRGKSTPRFSTWLGGVELPQPPSIGVNVRPRFRLVKRALIGLVAMVFLLPGEKSIGM